MNGCAPDAPTPTLPSCVVRASGPGDQVLREWRRRRREEQARADEALGRLLDEYTERLEAGDPDALRSARDHYDNDQGFPWNGEVLVSLGLLVLFGSVVLLVLLFAGIQHLVDG